MSARRIVWLVALAGCALAGMGGCSFDKSAHPDACSSASQCAAGQLCSMGFCIPSDDGNLTGKPCTSGPEPEPCYDGAEGTEDSGACKAGQRICSAGFYTQCLGQVVPTTEVCNGKDDDCNGTVDDLAAEACKAPTEGSCQAGTMVCKGSMQVCQPSALPVPEICDGLDNDCNGKVDDVGTSSCYPAARDGCVLHDDGSVACKGLCSPGVIQCRNGRATCIGAVVPRKEVCTPRGETGADEDCDGTVDEDCPCNDGDVTTCYSGPVGTRDQGACKAGTQTCDAQAWSSCQGEVLPSAESCSNPGSDDDCNGTVDDVPGEGETCYVAGNQGICRNGTRGCGAGSEQLTCVGQAPRQELCDAIDQDCDGDGYNGFDLTDPKTCGASCTHCHNGESCCGGSCIGTASLATDESNCGQCGNRCGASQFCCQGECISFSGGTTSNGDELCQCSQDCRDKSCCGRDCVDLGSDEKNCGGCGIGCDGNAKCCNGVCTSVCLLGVSL